MKKLVTHPAAFAVLYIVIMIPTYILPYFGSNSSLLNAAAATGGVVNPAMLVHLLCFAALLALAWFRGAEIGKGWLAVFPFLAMCFDFLPVLSLIPFVPTLMHLLTVVLGVIDNRGTATSAAS